MGEEPTQARAQPGQHQPEARVRDGLLLARSAPAHGSQQDGLAGSCWIGLKTRVTSSDDLVLPDGDHAVQEEAGARGAHHHHLTRNHGIDVGRQEHFVPIQQ